MGRYAFRRYEDALEFCALVYSRDNALAAIGDRSGGFWWVAVR